MEKTLLAIMNTKGEYLQSFEPALGRVLAYRAHWCDDFEHALLVDANSATEDDTNTERLLNWAETVGGKLVTIEMEYTVKEFETGEEREEYSESVEEFSFGGAVIDGLINAFKEVGWLDGDSEISEEFFEGIPDDFDDSDGEYDEDGDY